MQTLSFIPISLLIARFRHVQRIARIVPRESRWI
jgi:hypothetical protein